MELQIIGRAEELLQGGGIACPYRLGAKLEVPLENLPYLYEAWGTLCVIKVLLEVAHNGGYTVRAERLFRRLAGDAFVDLLPGAGRFSR